jgi:hypothetical protein
MGSTAGFYQEKKTNQNQHQTFKESLYIFLWVAGLSSLAYLPYIVLPLYAIDDYFLYQIYDIGLPHQWYNFYSTGRLVEGVLAEFFRLSNLQPITRPIGPILFILSLSFLSVTLLNSLRLKQFLLKLTFCILIVLNPFLAELFHYSSITVYCAFAIASLAVGFEYGRRYSLNGGWLDLCISVAMYSVSLAIYQIFYSMIFVFLLLLVALDLVKLKSEYGVDENNKRGLREFIPYILAFIVYTIALKIIFSIYPPPLPYPGTSLGEFVVNLANHDYWFRILFNINTYLFKDNPFNSANLNLLILLFLAYSMFDFIFNSFVNDKSRANIVNTVYITMSLILVSTIGFFGCLGFSVLRPWEISGRSLTAFGLYQALIVVLGFLLLRRNKPLSKFKVVLCTLIVGVIILGSAGRVGRVALDQYRLNSFDKSLATRIVTRLELLTDFAPSAKLIILGAPNEGTLSRTGFGDYNISALQHFSRVFAINEITGYSFQNPSNEDINAARIATQNLKPWPDKESVISDHGKFIVKLQ